MKIYVVIKEEKLDKLNRWISDLIKENFEDVVNSPIVETTTDGRTFRKEFCSFVNIRGDKLYKIDDETVNFLLTVVRERKCEYYVYDVDTDIVREICGDYKRMSFQRFLDNL